MVDGGTRSPIDMIAHLNRRVKRRMKKMKNQNWLAALKNDKKLVVSAAGCAEKAVRLIMGTCDKNDEEG